MAADRRDMAKLEDLALAAGVETYHLTREELIAWRNTALSEGLMHHAVFLSHVIWWLSTLAEGEASHVTA